MNDPNFNSRLKEILMKDSRYAPEAYVFMGLAVSHTVKLLSASRQNRHVSGKELLDGLSDLAKREYGPLAYEVLKGWGIEDDKSIGRIVFNMVENSLLSKTEDDKIEDFDLGFTLKDILGVDDKPPQLSIQSNQDIIIE